MTRSYADQQEHGGALPNLEIRKMLDADNSGYSVDDAVADALAVAEDRHFWHQTRNELISGELRRRGVPDGANVLELGCGGGCVTRHLAGLDYRVTGVEGHLELARRAARRAPKASIIVDDILRADLLRDRVGEFDAVGLFDVIEHLDDPGSAVTAALNLARPGGLLIGTVPALPFLWSNADLIARHRLRYTLEGLRDLLLGVAPDGVVDVIWFNRLLVPMIWATRRASNDTKVLGLQVPWKPVNASIRKLLLAEHAAARLFQGMSSIPGASLLFTVRR